MEKRLEAAFDQITGPWSRDLIVSETDVEGLEHTIAEQSSELNLRLIEILELYNIQARRTEDLHAAYEEIVRLEQTVSELAVEKDEIDRLEKEKIVLSKERVLNLLEIEKLRVRLNATKGALDAEKAKTASAHAEIDHLKFELAAATAERFKLVAMVYAEREKAFSRHALLR